MVRTRYTDQSEVNTALTLLQQTASPIAFAELERLFLQEQTIAANRAARVKEPEHAAA